MDAVRCLNCGETRWSLFSETFERLLSEPCPVCGGDTVVERRRPGTSLRRPLVERRNRGAFQPSTLAGAGGSRSRAGA
jgi:hypothetical protein